MLWSDFTVTFRLGLQLGNMVMVRVGFMVRFRVRL